MSLPQNIQALVTKQSGGTDRTVEVQTIPFGDTLKIKTLAPNEIVVLSSCARIYVADR